MSKPLVLTKVILPNLEELRLRGVKSRELWERESICFHNLTSIRVEDCPHLRNLFTMSIAKSLGQLQYLGLGGCGEMESICFHNPTSIRVEDCPHLRNLFTMSIAKSLGQLQYLGLGGCGEMEYIVGREEEKPEEAANKIVIPQLVTLYIHKMPKLKSFCHEKHLSEWPSLKQLSVEDCKAVKMILGDMSCRKLGGSIPMKQPLLLVEKVCTHFL
ncbi:hypothetical protein BT93_L1391 [Corymbia citriodora subsp. variegata]|uniref:Disease resistance protein At4g27190-like leucine-rich repeats domain-containing protein n=1 Tax=Corymbia citriodora subsp. variegata TaxID=360336 RepID=A0A8T0CII0_CORYI|nr:hypothetical protein BT93_L1391 [Corymbia citriodora subsp. variegata]